MKSAHKKGGTVTIYKNPYSVPRIVEGKAKLIKFIRITNIQTAAKMWIVQFLDAPAGAPKCMRLVVE